MAESTEIREQSLPRVDARPGKGLWERGWGKTKLILARSIFWAYERRTWQYDLIVLAILAFIFLTPRSWFDDRPTLQLTDLRHNQGIVEVGRGREGWSYLVDARLVESLNPMKPEEAIREILRRRLQKPFTVKSVDVIRDRNNVILGYTAVVTQ